MVFFFMNLKEMVTELTALKELREVLKKDTEEKQTELARYRGALGSLNALFNKTDVIWAAIRELESTVKTAESELSRAKSAQKQNKDAVTKLSAQVNYAEKNSASTVSVEFDVSLMSFEQIIDAIYYANESKLAVFNLDQLDAWRKYADSVSEFESHKPNKIAFGLQQDRVKDLVEVVGSNNYKTLKAGDKTRIELTINSSAYQRKFNEHVVEIRSRFYRCRSQERYS